MDTSAVDREVARITAELDQEDARLKAVSLAVGRHYAIQVKVFGMPDEIAGDLALAFQEAIMHPHSTMHVVVDDA